MEHEPDWEDLNRNYSTVFCWILYFLLLLNRWYKELSFYQSKHCTWQFCIRTARILRTIRRNSLDRNNWNAAVLLSLLVKIDKNIADDPC